MADNPSAFPVAPILPDIREGSDGMTLRDYFAGQALVGLCIDSVFTFDHVAEEAYRFADAMLTARENPNG